MITETRKALLGTFGVFGATYGLAEATDRGLKWSD